MLDGETADQYRLNVQNVAVDNMVIHFARLAYRWNRKIKSEKRIPDCEEKLPDFAKTCVKCRVLKLIEIQHFSMKASVFIRCLTHYSFK